MNLNYYDNGVLKSRSPSSFISRETYEHYKTLVSYGPAINDYNAFTGRTASMVGLEGINSVYNVCYLVEFKPVNGASMRLTNYYVDVTYSGNSYLASDDIEDISLITSGNAINTKTTDIKMNGVDQSFVTNNAASYWKKGEVVIRIAYVLMSNGTCVSSQIAWRGTIGKIVHKVDPTSAKTGITFSVEGAFAKLEKTPTPNCSPALQKSKFPSDTLFDWSGRALADVRWKSIKQ